MLSPVSQASHTWALISQPPPPTPASTTLPPARRSDSSHHHSVGADHHAIMIQFCLNRVNTSPGNGDFYEHVSFCACVYKIFNVFISLYEWLYINLCRYVLSSKGKRMIQNFKPLFVLGSGAFSGSSHWIKCLTRIIGGARTHSRTHI